MPRTVNTQGVGAAVNMDPLLTSDKSNYKVTDCEPPLVELTGKISVDPEQPHKIIADQEQ